MDYNTALTGEYFFESPVVKRTQTVIQYSNVRPA